VKYSEQEMAALISEVETQFAESLAKAEQEAKIEEPKTEEVKVQKTEEVAKQESEFDYDEEDFAEMDKLYQSMSKAEQDAHYQAIKKTIFGSDTINKTEEVKEVKIEKKEDKLAKAEIESLKEENTELKKNLEKLTEAFTKFIKKEAPQRKAITKIEYIKKTEAEATVAPTKKDASQLSQKEISNILCEKIRSEKLEKKDREAIDTYYNNTQSIELIKHLL